MLDDDNGDILFFFDVQDEPCHVFGFLGIHPGHRFVHQKDPRPHGQGPGKFYPFLQPVGQGSNRLLPDGFNFQKLNDLGFHFLSQGHLFSVGRPQIPEAG